MQEEAGDIEEDDAFELPPLVRPALEALPLEQDVHIPVLAPSHDAHKHDAAPTHDAKPLNVAERADESDRARTPREHSAAT